MACAECQSTVILMNDKVQHYIHNYIHFAQCNSTSVILLKDTLISVILLTAILFRGILLNCFVLVSFC